MGFLHYRSCLVLLAILFVAACGKPGPMGPAGPQGVQGETGAQGVSGPAGYYVQLCRGTTHYPDTFCEEAFCQDGTLHGVYSANGGFDSSLPEGAYMSNGINCSCTVTIGPNCEVSRG
jgi:hypothetical protein